jgi:hypothetical protein
VSVVSKGLQSGRPIILKNGILNTNGDLGLGVNRHVHLNVVNDSPSFILDV